MKSYLHFGELKIDYIIKVESIIHSYPVWSMKLTFYDGLNEKSSL